MDQPAARPALAPAQPRSQHIRMYGICFLAGLLIGQSVLAERDALLTLLARGDAAGAERSTTMNVAHRSAFPC